MPESLFVVSLSLIISIVLLKLALASFLKESNDEPENTRSKTTNAAEGDHLAAKATEGNSFFYYLL